MKATSRTVAMLLAAALVVNLTIVAAGHHHPRALGASSAGSADVDHGGRHPHAHLHHREKSDHSPCRDHDDDCLICRCLAQVSLSNPLPAILPPTDAVRLAPPAAVEAPQTAVATLFRTRAPPQAV